MVSPLTASSKKRRGKGKGGGPGSACVSVGERGSLRVITMEAIMSWVSVVLGHIFERKG